MSTEEDEERSAVRKRLEARRDFSSHLAAFIVVNGMFIVIWAMTGGGYFWPAWILGLWAIGLILHAWDVFMRKPVTDADVENELRRMRSGD